jgi:hypothetical protein
LTQQDEKSEKVYKCDTCLWGTNQPWVYFEGWERCYLCEDYNLWESAHETDKS